MLITLNIVDEDSIAVRFTDISEVRKHPLDKNYSVVFIDNHESGFFVKDKFVDITEK